MPILVKHPGTAGQAHGRQAVILGNHHIPGCTRFTRAKSALSAPWDTVTVSAPGRSIRWAWSHTRVTGTPALPGFLQALRHHGTGIRVHEQAHGSSFSYRE